MNSSCYIERFATHDTLTGDPKVLIPDPMMRRRMSRTVKMGVQTGLACLQGERPDAIVTATGFGCLTDSEKFLRNLLEHDEELLTPTPFIQSTFNTIGAQIALLTGCHGCNTTFAHRGHSFESALLEASMLLAEGSAHRLLVGATDEQTPSQYRIMERMGMWRHGEGSGEGATFVLLTDQPTDSSLGRVTAIDFPGMPLDATQIADQYGVDCVVCNTDLTTGCYPSASARVLVEGIGLLGSEVQHIALYNRYLNNPPSIILLSACS